MPLTIVLLSTVSLGFTGAENALENMPRKSKRCRMTSIDFESISNRLCYLVENCSPNRFAVESSLLAEASSQLLCTLFLASFSSPILLPFAATHCCV